MRTKYDIGQSVWLFEPNSEEVVSMKVDQIVIDDRCVIWYKVGEWLLQEERLYSCELQCRNHFRALFEK